MISKVNAVFFQLCLVLISLWSIINMTKVADDRRLILTSSHVKFSWMQRLSTLTGWKYDLCWQHRRTERGGHGGTVPPRIPQTAKFGQKWTFSFRAKIWRKNSGIWSYVERRYLCWPKSLMAEFDRILDVFALLESVFEHSIILLQSSSFLIHDTDLSVNIFPL